MGDGSGGGVAQALKDGLARAASAPAVLLGTLALTFLFSLSWQSPSPPLLDPGIAFSQYLTVLALSPFGEILALSQFGVSLHAPYAMVSLVVWSFLAGGILDRYARNRPTRGRGFFGACGAHFPAMLRLGIAEWLMLDFVAWLISFARDRAGLERHATYGPAVVLLAAGLVFLYARVRIVVEDRRSMLGALLAGGRFIRRNPATLPIFLIFAASVWVATSLWDQLAPQVGSPALLPFAAAELIVAFLLFLVFASWASATALFQARLAHASYTAAPPIEWPESPAAEAMTNLVRSAAP